MIGTERLARHAVDAAEVAAIGDRDAQSCIGAPRVSASSPPANCGAVDLPGRIGMTFFIALFLSGKS